MLKMRCSKQVLIFVLYFNFVKPFQAIVLILYPLKTLEAFQCSSIFKGYKMGHEPEMGRYEEVLNPCYVIIYNLI